MLAECELATDVVRCSIMMILYSGPSHGYSIMEILQARLGKAVSPAIVYPFLAGLVKAGYASSSQQRDGGRVRSIYKLTPSGRRFSERVLNRLSTIMSAAISPNASACANCGCRLLEPGHREEIGGKKLMFCCVHCAAAYRRDDSDT